MKKLIIYLITIIISICVNAQIVTYDIKRSVNVSDTIFVFESSTYSYGISIEGSGQLLSDSAYIRIILIDSQNRHWLMYEKNDLYVTEENTLLHGAAFETSLLDSIIPQAIIAQISSAVLNVNHIKNNKTKPNRININYASDSIFIAKNLQLVERINDTLIKYKKAWRADTTFLSNIRYQQRRRFFDDTIPNLRGWDYYKYGYYSPLNDNTPMASNNIVKEFDWRTRHGAMNSNSYYYNTDGSGWIPRRRYGQGASDCWAFSVVYSVEAMVNLYFNRQINNELSVQNILSCIGGNFTYGNGYLAIAALTFTETQGIINDSCFIYENWHLPSCDNQCSNPTERVFISGHSTSSIKGEDNIKEQLITKGVLVATVKRWGHAMCMVGFGVVKAGDPILYGNNSNTVQDIYVDADSPDIGKPYYIFKQSYARYGYDNTPFCNVIVDANNTEYLYRCYSIDTPITSMLYNNNDILCVDNDGDGYYNWGVGPKPSHCPNCPDTIDSDDSTPLIGPYNEKYESIILCDNYIYSQTPEHITQDTYWGSQKIIDHDIYVEDGTTLTIKNTIYMGPSTRIVVKPRGRLILGYNAKLTGLCDNMWQGIEVWGDSNADQLSHHGTYNQGYLEMKNGATIENAVCAVELWHPNYWGTTGGIIHATDAIFRNNAKAVHALNYVDHNLNGNEIAYNSQFTKCSFIIDENYLGTETFSKHVDLFNVNSVYFAGCHFSVKPQASGVSPYCIGIGAYGAGFLVESYCEEPNMHPSCPENDMVRSSFEGFNNGILSINENSQARSFTVRDASFINNNRGVFMQNTGYATIVRSDFRIGGNSSCGYGVYADGVTGFRIEENSFSPSQGILCPTYGIGIFNSRGVNDVYLNTFNQLTCGNIAYGVNNTADVLSEKPSASMPGLTYSCNDNTGNDIDFCVLKDNGTGGIASPQGSATVPAGNTFSGSNYHFYNGGDYEVKYFCNLSGINEIPDPNKMQYVDSDAITYTNDCASHYGNGGVVRSAEEKAALAAIYLSSGDAHERMTAAGDIVRSCLNEDATDATELRQWLGNMHELESDRMAVASYIQEGDFTNAQALASSLPSTYNLQGDDLSDHNDYMTLLGMYQTLHNSNRTIHEMTSSEKATVKDMAENGLGASQQMARAILMTISDRYIEPYICPEMPINSNRGTKSDNDNANTPSNDSELSVTVAPIPATTWVSVDYKLPCDTGTATMSVFNSLGVKVMEVELDGPQGTKTFDLQGMPDGVYSYIVRCGEYQNTGKLIITL